MRSEKAKTKFLHGSAESPQTNGWLAATTLLASAGSPGQQQASPLIAYLITEKSYKAQEKKTQTLSRP